MMDECALFSGNAVDWRHRRELDSRRAEARCPSSRPSSKGAIIMTIGNQLPRHRPAYFPPTPARRVERRTRLALAVALVLAAGLWDATSGRAGGLVIEAPNLVGVVPGTSGTFDVLLVDTDPTGTPGYNLAGDSLQVVLSGSAGSSIQFTNATINTVSAPYIFTQSLDGNNGFPLFTNTLPSTVLMTSDVGDVIGSYPGYTTVNPGETFGLANVSYTVSTSAPAGTSDAITFVLANGATSLSDPNGVAIPFTVMNGSIGTVVPEPSSLTQGTIAALTGVGLMLVLRVRARARGARFAG
jgi:hypothetical protein